MTQETLLFDDTVAENIRYGRLEATRDEIVEAAAAGARPSVHHRGAGRRLRDAASARAAIGSPAGSGSGSRWRRAILRDPEILILDEATSQIDVESERLIHQVLEEFTRGRTAFIITHRPSTLELADRIVVMDAGRIVDVGTFRRAGGAMPAVPAGWRTSTSARRRRCKPPARPVDSLWAIGPTVPAERGLFWRPRAGSDCRLGGQNVVSAGVDGPLQAESDCRPSQTLTRRRDVLVETILGQRGDMPTAEAPCRPFLFTTNSARVLC